MKTKHIKALLAIVLAVSVVLTSSLPSYIKAENSGIMTLDSGLEQEMLDTDAAYVKSLAVTKITDGTEPFDENDNRGNDNNGSNKIVRSYDSIRYTIDYTVQTYNTTHSYKNGYIWFEMKLPYSRDKAYFDTSVMNWMCEEEGYKWEITEDEDSQTLKCAMKLTPTGGNPTSIPGAGSIEAVIAVRAMNNEEVIQPEFSAYMDHNDISEGKDSVCDAHKDAENGGKEYVTAVPEEVKVTTVPGYNVQLKQVEKTGANATGKWDFSTGNDKALNKDKGTLEGRMVAYGITLQLYNEKTNQDMKGLEYPKGPITFDINFDTSFIKQNTMDDIPISDKCIPLVWSYGPSENKNPYDGRDLSATYGNTYLAAPYNSSGHTLSKDGALPNGTDCDTCWNGGNWSVVQEGNTLHCTVADYEINPNWFPTKNVSSNDKEYAERKHLGCFSAGQLFIVVPYGTLQDEYGDGTIQVNVTDSNMNAESVTGMSQTNDDQKDKTDDSVATVVHLSSPGNYVNKVHYGYYGTNEIVWAEDADQVTAGDCYNNGKDALAINGNVAIVWGGVNKSEGDIENFAEAGDFLLKFDDEALEIDTGKNIVSKMTGYNTYYYGAKTDGKGWESDEEMNEYGVSDLVYYESLEELEKEGKICVGILWKYRCDHSAQNHADHNNQDITSKAYFHIKNDNLLTGNVYQTVSAADIWRKKSLYSLVDASGVIDVTKLPSIYDVQKNGAIQLAKDVDDLKYNYKKAYYNESGYQGGHTAVSNGWEEGDSLYLAGYISKINKKILQADAGGAAKNTFDMDHGQNIVDFELSPYMEVPEGVVWNNKTDMTIVDYLPPGLTYVSGSAYIGAKYIPDANGLDGRFVGGQTLDEPVIGTKEIDGKIYTTLTWVINTDVKYEQPQIFYKARIANDVITGTEFRSAADVATNEDIRDRTKQNGNYDDVGFNVVKLTNLSVTKRAEYSCYDINDEIKYTITWSNNSDANLIDKVMLDIMPQSGHNHSFYNGYYEISGLSITDSSPYEVYYTTDKNVISMDKDTVTYAEIKSGYVDGIQWKSAGSLGSYDFGADTANVTAWAILGNINRADYVTATLTMQPHGNLPKDVYYNEANIDNVNVSAKTEIVNRILSGTTWVDANQDGKRDVSEKLMQGVTVTVYDSKGNVVKDLKDGKECTAKTDASGNYLFENLPEGEFTVKFTDGDVELSGYTLTVSNAEGVSEDVNSDAVKTGADISIGGINMPPAEDITSSPYMVEHQDAGFYQTGDLAITKNVQGGESDDEKNFEITVTFKDGPIALSEVKDSAGKNYEVSDNKIVITLTDKQTVTLKDIPAGTVYEVSEKDYKFFSESIEYGNASRKITNVCDTVNVNNRKVNRMLSGTTWVDANKDGKRDASEKLLQGVTVTVYDSEGNIVKDLKNNENCTAKTDTSGNYLFEYLPAGEFRVEFTDGDTKISEYTLTVPNAEDVSKDVNSDAVNKDGMPVIEGIEMPEDKNITSSPYKVEHQDAGFYQTGSIAITKTVENAEAGDTDSFEITVKFTDGPIALSEVKDSGDKTYPVKDGKVTLTLKSGETIELVDLPPETTYEVTEKDSPLYAESYVYSDSKHMIDVTRDTVEVINKRVNRVLSGTTWVDANQDGKRDASEKLLQGVTVTVYDSEGKVVKDLKDGKECTAVTDGNGNYLFENLPAGDFTVEFTDGDTKISEYTLTVSKADGVNEDVNSDAVNKEGTPVIENVVMPKDEEITSSPYKVEHQDAGFYQTGSLAVTKTVKNAEAGDAESFDITVEFTGGPVTLNKVTDASGETYPVTDGKVTLTLKTGETIELVNLPFGTTYEITEKDSPLYIESYVYKDAVHMVDTTQDTVEVINKRVNRVLSGTTWVDANQDGKRDVSEEVMQGVTVTVYDSEGNIVKDLKDGKECTAVTDGNGNYLFENLPAGDFTVEFTDGDTKISEYTLTVSKADGVNEDVNSDAVNKEGTPVIENVVMPKDEEITSSPYKVEHQDAGFYQTGSLAVTKTVENAEAGDAESFDITVTFTGGPIALSEVKDSGNKVYPVTDGKVTLAVEAGKTIELVNLPFGTTYGVTEEDSPLYIEGYVYSDSEHMIDVTRDTVEVINKRVNRMLSGTTWVDANQDGKRDVSEKVMQGVTVTVYDSEGNIVKDLKDGKECTAKTDTSGNYLFENLPAGEFTVEFTDGDTKISEYKLTVPNAEDVSKDVNSDAVNKEGTPVIENVVMPKDEEITSSPYKVEHQDAGFYQTGDLAITKNVQGGESDDEKKFEITVTFTDGPVTLSEVKDSNGEIYKVSDNKIVITLTDKQTVTLKDIPAGTVYEVSEKDYKFFSESIEYGNASREITNVCDTVDVNNRKVNRMLSGTTWVDANQDGKRDASEKLLSGVTVTVYDSEGNVVKDLKNNADCTAKTDSSGNYLFEYLPAGELRVEFTDGDTKISEYTLTVPNAEDVSKDVNSDAVNKDGMPVIEGIEMPEDKNITSSPYKVEHQDAGFYRTGSLAVTKTVENAEADDADSFEITVAFTDGPIALKEVKDAGGKTYSVKDGKITLSVEAGKTIELVNLPYGTAYEVTEKDSPLYAESYVYSDETKTIDITNDAVEVINKRVNRVLSGTTWVDANQNGKRDASEKLMQGVTVTVYDSEGKVVKDLKDGKECTAVTDENGNYLFENLPAGDFTVEFTDGDTKISKYTLTVSKADGVSDAENSDAAKDENGTPVIEGIEMPEDKDITSSPYKVEHQDAGFYQTGSLAVTKTVENAEVGDADSFDITVTFTGGPVALSEVKGAGGKTYPVKDGKITLTLKAGETAEFIELPFGTTYDVTEKDSPLYLESYLYKDAAHMVDTTQDTVEVINKRVNRVLSGTTWVDANQDGKRDVSEELMQGVTVTVYDSEGNIVKDVKDGKECTTVTDENGNYLFENLPDGDFTVEFTDGDTKISEYTLTVSKADGVNEDVNSDAVNKEGTPVIENVVMPKDEEITSSPYKIEHQDAGFYQTGSLAVTKTVENAEAGDAESFDITVTFTGGPIALSEVKDAGGKSYPVTEGKITLTLKAGETAEIIELPYGTTYEVTEADSQLYEESYVYADEAKTVDVVKDSVEVINRRVNRMLSGTTWADKNRNGKREDSEKLLSGVTVTVYDSEGNIVKDLKDGKECTAVTDENGNYLFENLPAGDFTIEFTDGDTKISEYTLTVSKADGVDESVNSDAVNKEGTPVIENVVMPKDEDIKKSPYRAEHNDAGFYKNGSLAVTKTVINGEKGDKDGFEITVQFDSPAVLKEVKDSNNNTYAVTDGKVVFTIKAGETVEFIDLPEETVYEVTEKDSPLYTEGYIYSDSEHMIDVTRDTVEVVNRRVNRKLSGTTWIDDNMDGKRDSSEKLLPGVTVTVYDSKGNIVKDLKDGKECKAVTDENGNYLFENLPAGEFTVEFTDGDTKISEYTLTVPKADGVDEDANSDAAKDETGTPSIGGIPMPEDNEIEEPLYSVEHQDAGFYPKAEPTKAPEPTGTPEPTATPESTVTPEPTGTPEPTKAPEPTGTSELAKTPAPAAEPTAGTVIVSTQEPKITDASEKDDKVSDAEETSETGEKDDAAEEVAKTGDETPIAGYIICIAVCIVFLGIMLTGRRRKTDK